MNRIAFIYLACIVMASCNAKPDTTGTFQISPAKDSANAYAGPHHYHHSMYDAYNLSGEQQWDSLHGITTTGSRTFEHESHPDYKVFGWHMYSGGTAYKEYNFSLLWAVAYFCYQVDASTGKYKNIYDWKTTPMIDLAKKSGCKVLLTVGNFGTHDNTALLDNPKAMETLGDSLVALLKYRDADGVNIDFEGVPASRKDKFSGFIVSLSQKLKAADPKYMMTLALYAVDHQKVFDIKSINDAVDTYIMMGYDYYGSFSSSAGPSAPLKSSSTWGPESLENSIDHYLAAGVAPAKLIVGLPYYGEEWDVESAKLPSKSKKYDHTYSYRIIRQKFTDSLKYPPLLDKEAAACYYTLTDKDGSTKQVWYEDTLSLSVKYDYIKSKGLAGAGIWTLGYDHGYNDLWNLLGKKFGKSK